jgi:NAD(P)H-hydrate epimerase
MKILTDNQIRNADRITIEREQISSLELMERAASGIAEWFVENIDPRRRLVFCCGRGGNGGDGVAAARILADAGRDCTVFLSANPGELTDDARANFARLPKEVEVVDITVERPDIEADAVVVDALLGVGMTGEVRQPVKNIIEWINLLPNLVISIDLPSGMAAGWGSDQAGGSRRFIHAGTTLTIEFPKLALLLPETGQYAGNTVVIPIGLDEEFIATADTPYYYITQEWVDGLRRPRAKFSHKGDYGHVLMVCGSATMPGAAILAAGGALRSGCGLVTAHVPKNERFALVANCPSAMLSLDDNDCFSAPPDRLERFSAIGVGPGLGRDAKTVNALREMLEVVSGMTGLASGVRKMRMVFDADALNIIAQNPDLKQFIPSDSVLTPHPGELRRLVGDWADDREKLDKASRFATETASVVIVKGAHSVICTPDGRFIFNSTGTPGMAKGGSGDVLTGLLAGLLARGYDA